MSATGNIEKIRSTNRSEQGFKVFVLRNEAIELALVPALGAKVISLRNLVTGYEWMWHPPAGMRLFHNRPGDDFGASTLIGWDECIPTIAPCIWKGRVLPDHGEAWTVPWNLDPEAFDRGVLKTSLSLAVSPFRFERCIELRGNEIYLNYQLENLSNEPEEFLWAIHPLLPASDGIRLQLTHETRNVLTGEEWVTALNFGAGKPACVKIFAGPLREGRAGVLDTIARDHLRFEWDTSSNQTLGLWLSRGGWNGCHHLALEPCNGAPDSLAEAAQAGRCGIIPPKEKQSWKIKLILGA